MIKRPLVDTQNTYDYNCIYENPEPIFPSHLVKNVDPAFATIQNMAFFFKLMSGLLRKRGIAFMMGHALSHRVFFKRLQVSTIDVLLWN